MSFEPRDSSTLRRAFSALADDATQERVDDERVWQAVRGELSEEERHALIEELPHRPALAESWRIAMALSEELDGASDAVPQRRPEIASQGTLPRAATRSRRKSTLWISAWAAAAALVAFVGLQQVPWSPLENAPAYRVADDQRIVSGLDEQVALPRHDFTLRWSALEGAQYRLRVLRPDLQVVVETERLDKTEFRVAAEDLEGIADGTQLLWQVDARLADGTSLTSATFFATLGSGE